MRFRTGKFEGRTMEHVVLLVLTCPGAVVELERSLIVERVYAGPRGRCYGSLGPP